MMVNHVKCLGWCGHQGRLEALLSHRPRLLSTRHFSYPYLTTQRPWKKPRQGLSCHLCNSPNATASLNQRQPQRGRSFPGPSGPGPHCPGHLHLQAGSLLLEVEVICAWIPGGRWSRQSALWVRESGLRCAEEGRTACWYRQVDMQMRDGTGTQQHCRSQHQQRKCRLVACGPGRLDSASSWACCAEHAMASHTAGGTH